MVDKSNEEFQKDILEILKKGGEDNEKFKKEIKEIVEKKPEQVQKREGFSYGTNIVTSTKTPLPPEELQKRVAEIGVLLKPIMEKYQLSKLECFVIRNYE